MHFPRHPGLLRSSSTKSVSDSSDCICLSTLLAPDDVSRAIEIFRAELLLELSVGGATADGLRVRGVTPAATPGIGALASPSHGGSLGSDGHVHPHAPRPATAGRTPKRPQLAADLHMRSQWD